MWKCAPFLVCLIFTGCNFADDPESSTNKSEWGCLQSVEYENRGKGITGVEFMKRDGHDLVCIPDHGRNIWVMLRAEGAPYYKQMPADENFSLSKTDYQKIVDANIASPTVLACLKSHLE